MARQAEEVYIEVNHVKSKKVDGSLYVMNNRIAWKPTIKDNFTISYNFTDIKSQKISPDTKDKVQLQVVTHDMAASTFHFCNPAGREKQKSERDQVKDMLSQLLPRFRRQVSSHLEEKKSMLQSNPQMFQLYKDLVVSGVISSDEFWSTIVKDKSTAADSQTVGVSQNFLSDVKPQTDGANGLRYSITPEIRLAIFKTYPSVKKKHIENVPGNMTEAEFWTSFFQSHYFHRDRLTAGAKDLFADCALADDKDIERELRLGIPDALVDLTHFSDNSLGEGYGVDRPSQGGSRNAAQQLLRRFNHHSTRVLQAAEAMSADSVTTNQAAGDKQNGQTDEPPSKQARLREKLEYSDLESDGADDGAVLTLSGLERYLAGPTVIRGASYSTSEDMIRAGLRLKQQFSDPDSFRTRSAVSNKYALAALKELSPGGSLMLGPSATQLQELVTPALSEELRQHYVALSELLRHFWLCFPVVNKDLEDKVVRMNGYLLKFKQSKLLPFKQQLIEKNVHVDLTSHMEQMLQTATDKFDLWQSRARR